ncbi:MAG: hypothetical protein ACRC5M_02795 [Anaeroplasmataceae bacterium]
MLSTKEKEFENILTDMRKYKITQKSMVNSLGWGINSWTKLKKGQAKLTKAKLNAIRKELDNQIELWKLKQEATDITVLRNITMGINKYNLEIEKVELCQDEDGNSYFDEITKDNLSFVQREVALRQKIKRNQNRFEPCVMASVDMITLSRVINEHEEKILFESLKSMIVTDVRLMETVNPHYDSQVGRFRYIYNFEGDDVKVGMEYTYRDFNEKKDVRLLKVRFNPNKWYGENNFLKILFLILGQDPLVHNFDVCKDYLKFTYKDVYYDDSKDTSTRTDELGVRTVYFGRKEDKNVNLMVYDKRQEILKKDNVDIGYDCLRAETRIFLKANRRFYLTSDVEKIKVPIIPYSCALFKFKHDIDEIDRLLYKAFLRRDEDINFLRYSKKLKHIAQNQFERKDTVAIATIEVTSAIRMFSYRYRIAYAECLVNRLDILKYPDATTSEKDKKLNRQKEKAIRDDIYIYYKDYLKEPIPNELLKRLNEKEKEEFKNNEKEKINELHEKYAKKINSYEPVQSKFDWYKL